MKTTVRIGTLDGDGMRSVIRDSDDSTIGRVRCDAGPVTTGPGEVVELADRDVVRFGDGTAYRLEW